MTGGENRTRTAVSSPPVSEWEEPLCSGAADAARVLEFCAIGGVHVSRHGFPVPSAGD